MRSRSSHLRTKVLALLLSLAALWTFAAVVTLREGLNLLWVNTLTNQVGRPTESLVAALQQERRLSVVYLGARDRADRREALATHRLTTDRELAGFRRRVASTSVGWASSDALARRLDEMSRLLDRLHEHRDSVDTGLFDRSRAAVAYTSIVDAGFRVYGAISVLDDEAIAKQSRTLVALSRARELLSQEDALLAGVIAAGRWGGDDHSRFVALVGAQRFQYAEAAAELTTEDRALYQKQVSGPAMVNLRTIEDRVVENGRAGAASPVDAAVWTGAVEAGLGELRALELGLAEATLQRAKPAAAWVVVRLALATGLGLIAVIASIIMSITTARSIVRQLERLRNAANELANERLPRVVAKLSRGEEVDVATEAPPLAFGTDEIGQVGHAFNAVQQTAIQAAVGQAQLRTSVRDVFLSLARRTQALVHRQLGMLDAMERRATDAENLQDLFRVDHFATRMRRNAENLIVLSGAVPGRGWRHAVPMVDVLRGAIAEVEEYTRVSVAPVAPAALAGRAVGDVMHLLAELIENAVSFSPPYTTVHVGGLRVANGYAVEIEDRGLGMSEEAIAAANAQLREAPEFNMVNANRLGLYVIGRLAARHGIRVRLRESPYGGTTAIVLIPAALVAEADTSAQFGRVVRHRAATGLGDAAPEHAVDGVSIGVAGNHSSDPAVPERIDVLDFPTVTVPATGIARVDRPASAPASVARALVAQSQPPPDATADTILGLPRRVRQADGAAAPTAATGNGRHADTERDTTVEARTPEQIRELMGAYQAGTRRGRSDVERAAPETLPAPEAAPATPATPSEPAAHPTEPSTHAHPDPPGETQNSTPA